MGFLEVLGKVWKLEQDHASANIETRDAFKRPWFRPVTWAGTGQAFCFLDGRIVQVPSMKGGVRPFMLDPDTFLGHWEIVDSSDVNAEWP